jgi:sterol desaturase/sphingolipid hydroxylase (fatty acid hydroxylase superfamily)
MINHEYAWFATFWGLVTILCFVEAIWPGSGIHADRSRRWPVNFGLGILNGLIASLAPPLTVLSAIWAADHAIGALNVLASPLWFAILVALIVKSFAQYAFHRCAHRFALLWRVHRVHHCDVHLDVSSALRFHPIEMIAALLFTIPFVLVFGLPPKILAAYEVVQIVAGLVTHANIRVPETIERGARLLFVTPVLHRLHHSAREAEANRNYCDVFSLWDRLFGTFHDVPLGTTGPAQFGLEDVNPALAGDFFTQLRLQSYPRVVRSHANDPQVPYQPSATPSREV